MNINLYGDNILVSELTDDLFINGLLVMYDKDNPYMFCKVEALSYEADKTISKNDILVIKRYAKEEYLPGYYFVSLKDVRGSITSSEYNKLLNN